MAFTKTFQAGGVERLVTKNFDLDRALHREKLKAFAELMRELELSGHLTYSPREMRGDYTVQTLALRLDANG